MLPCVAAIRLDEYFSGWAISFVIYSNDIHSGFFDHLLSSRNSSAVLVKPDGETLSDFGYDAEQKYAKLRDKNAHGEYYYFPDILVNLRQYYENSRNDTEPIILKEEGGKTMHAVTAYSMVIKHLTSYIKASIKQKDKKGQFDTDFYYVITVPAFLKESPGISLITSAVLLAGIDENKFSVVTDIDAVSVYYQQLLFDGNISSSESKYYIVRAGGTTDIMKHEMNKPPNVASYKDGKTLVDDAFEEYFMDMYGKEEFEKFKDTQSVEYLEFGDYLCYKQRTLGERNESMVRIRLPGYLMTLCTNIYQRQGRQPYPKDYRFIADKLEITFDKCLSIFDVVMELVISHIISEKGNEKMDVLLMFGQFLELTVFQRLVKEHFPNVRIVSSSDVLKGAIIIGYRKQSGRIMKMVPKRVIVAAIDFGTTYSGWAFSNATDFESDRTKASVKKWHSGSMQTEKTPTCILIRPDGKTIEAFGYDAENRYRDLQESGEHEQYYFFKHFKMMLHKKLEEKINRDETLEDIMGRSLPALDVFSLSIRFLKDDVKSTTEKQLAGQIQKQDIHWVLTVPAIWTDGAKQFMRESAIKAGIKPKSLTIALEPEAASIYCRHLPLEATVDKTGDSVSSFKPGTRYMILDAGGGTIDLTVHEVDSKDGVKEVHAACGGSWGGTMVDKEFENVLIDIVGQTVFSRFKTENVEDYLELSRDFEIKKRAINPSATSPVRMRLPLSLIEQFENDQNTKMANVISKSKFSEDIQMIGDKMKISAELAKSFFRRSVDNTVNYVKRTLQDTQVTTILMVGGYSESPMLQEAIKSNFANVEVVIPLDASYSIMKGALIFGHLPKFIKTRVLKYTYGIGVNVSFVEGNHPESKRIHTDKGDKCKDIFDKHVGKNQSVVVDEAQICKSYLPTYKQQKEITIQVYASAMLNPEYTDQNCCLVGKLTVALGKDGDLDRKVSVALTFSDTEIVVEAKDETSGIKTHAAIDFLG